MKSRIALLLILLGFTGIANAQYTMHKLLHAGYVYQNQSFGEVGGRLLFLENDDVIFRVGAAALMGSVNGKFAAMPKVQGDILLNFERGRDFYHSWYFLGGAEVTSKYVAPKAGFTIAGLLDLTAGYGFSLSKKGLRGKELKGLNIGATLSLPIPLLHDLLN